MQHVRDAQHGAAVILVAVHEHHGGAIAARNQPSSQTQPVARRDSFFLEHHLPVGGRALGHLARVARVRDHAMRFGFGFCGKRNQSEREQQKNKANRDTAKAGHWPALYERLKCAAPRAP